MSNINLSNKPGLQDSNCHRKTNVPKGLKNSSLDKIDYENKSTDPSKEKKDNSTKQIIGILLIILSIFFIVYDLQSQNSIFKSFMTDKEESIKLSNKSILDILDLVNEAANNSSDINSSIIIESFYIQPESRDFSFRVGMICQEEEYYNLIDKVKQVELYENLKLYNYKQKKYLEAEAKYEIDDLIKRNFDLATLRKNINEKFKDSFSDPEDLYMSELTNENITYKMNSLKDISSIITYMIKDRKIIGDFIITITIADELELNNYNLVIQ